MKAKNIPLLLMALTIAVLTTACGTFPIKTSEINVLLMPQNSAVPVTFKNLDKEISVRVETSLPYNSPSIDYADTYPKKLIKIQPKIKYSQTLTAFATDATTDYMQKLRFDVASVGDCRLDININVCKVIYTGKSSATAKISMTYRLIDKAGETVIPSTRIDVSENALTTTWGQVYYKALNQINWDRIAKYLTMGSTPKEEKNAKVKGDGDTALEHTVIRWNILSSPQGADVSWRVISSTPDVANTNSNFVGTTPYESTESFDIKGLTYNNSGNVQIEVSCERSGYLTQRKRFNLRQAIDQKEISAKFNLIKDE